MDISEMIQLQRQFDSLRQTTFAWSSPISEKDSSALVHNVLSLAGEVGELANLVKKYERGDFSYDQLIELVPGELADVLIYLMKIAYQTGLDLEKAFIDKLAENEDRFPRSQNLEAPKKEWQEELPETRMFLRMSPPDLHAEVDKWAKRASSVASDEVTRTLEISADQIGVALPTSRQGKFAAAILASIFAEASLLEGRPEDREMLWSRLSPVAEAYHLTRSQLAALTAGVGSISKVLENVFSDRKVWSPDE